MVACPDANWTGDERSRASISGGTVLFGQHWVKSLSKTQSFTGKATAEVWGIQWIANGFENRETVRSFVDASAAFGSTCRRGIRQVRHLDASHLWLQEVPALKQAQHEKATGTKPSRFDDEAGCTRKRR